MNDGYSIAISLLKVGDIVIKRMVPLPGEDSREATEITYLVLNSDPIATRFYSTVTRGSTVVRREVVTFSNIGQITLVSEHIRNGRTQWQMTNR